MLASIDVEFEVRFLPEVDELYPESLSRDAVAEYVAREKAAAYLARLTGRELLITADTLVLLGDLILGKPDGEEDARRMLKLLSGRTHRVITGVALTSTRKQVSFSETTRVTFAELHDKEIDYYVNRYRPLDKAGAYGVQEWIGYAAVERIEGSYHNVMGLPISKVYRELKKF